MSTASTNNKSATTTATTTATANISFQQTLATPISNQDADVLSAVIFEEAEDVCDDFSERAGASRSGESGSVDAASAAAALCSVDVDASAVDTGSVAADAVDAEPATSAEPADSARVSAPQHCTYVDCLMGRANVPTSGPGKSVFQLLMVGGMVSFMATISGVMHSGLDFFAHAHWMYPLVFCMAFFARLLIGDKVVGYVAPRFVIPRFNGLARSIAMTVLNVLVMGLVMGAAVNMLLSGPAGFLSAYVNSLPVTLTVAALVNFFIVGPVVKMLYNNVIEPTNGLGIFQFFQRFGMSWAAIFGN